LMTSDLACSRARMAASRPTVGKSSRNSSRVWPPSRYSKRVWKGTRVPRKTGVPPRTSGSRTIISLPEAIAFQVYSEGQLRPTETGGPPLRLCFLQRWGAEDSCSAGLPSHLRRFPLKYKTPLREGVFSTGSHGGEVRCGRYSTHASTQYDIT